eukprot:jgi/Tetstr1/427031/TSEL_017236.t1
MLFDKAIKVRERFFKLYHKITRGSRTKVITAKRAAMRAQATVKVAAKQAASGVARTKFAKERKMSKHMVQKHVDAVMALGIDKNK